MIDLDILRRELKTTLANDICSAQALDVPADRRRVLDEIMRTIATFNEEVDGYADDVPEYDVAD